MNIFLYWRKQAIIIPFEMKEIVFIEQKHMFAKKSAIAEINVDMTEIKW